MLGALDSSPTDPSGKLRLHQRLVGGNGKDFAQEPASQFQQSGDIDYVEFVERAELAYF